MATAAMDLQQHLIIIVEEGAERTIDSIIICLPCPLYKIVPLSTANDQRPTSQRGNDQYDLVVPE